MLRLFGLILACFMFLCKATTCANTTLKFVQVITRHGARTPYARLPVQESAVWNCTQHNLVVGLNDETPSIHLPRIYRKNYIRNRQSFLGNIDFLIKIYIIHMVINIYLYFPSGNVGNCMTGQLTHAGAEMHLQLGQQFRQTYVEELNFLPKSYPNPDEIYVRSTDVPRTIASAGAQLAGFFPPRSDDFNHHSDVQVVDIEVIEAGSTENLAPSGKCAKMVQQCNEVQTTVDWQTQNQLFEPVKQNLSEAWKVNISEIPDVNDLYDNFYARSWHNLTLPTGVNDATYDAVKHTATNQLNAVYKYKDVARLGIGVFMGEVIDRFDQHVQGVNTDLKWVYYSAHDTTCGLFLAALETLTDWPPYATHIVMELHQDKQNQWFLRLLYNDEVQHLEVCDQEDMCPYDSFKELAERSVMSQQDWQQECDSQGPADGEGWVGKYLC